MNLLSNLLSGLVGALAVQLLAMLWGEIKRKREYNALLNGIIAECDYNLGIVDEICAGVVHGFSFKRMSVEFFRSAREASVKYTDASGVEFTINQPCAESGISAKILQSAKPNVPLPIWLVLVVMADFILLLSLFMLFAMGNIFSMEMQAAFTKFLKVRFLLDSRPVATVIIAFLATTIVFSWILCWYCVRQTKIAHEDRKADLELLKFVAEKSINSRLLLNVPSVEIYSQLATVQAKGC